MTATYKPPTDVETIGGHLERMGVNRRDFLSFCGKLMVAAPFGLAITNHLTPEAAAQEIASARRPSVIWLHFQECTGCTETLLRTSQPGLADLITGIISLDYHETVMAAAGHDAELALQDAIRDNDGKFILVVEGALPTANDGIYMYKAGRKGIDMLRDVASHAGAIISMGSCASWGGIPSSGPNPTGAVGVDKIITDKPIINIPGCPPNPYIFLAAALQYAKTGTVPALDDKKRPKFAFDRLIHEQCPRRPHFDAGRFAKTFGDAGHSQGWCLYRLGCKGPATFASCSTRHFNEVVDAWPIGIGSPCFGCTEQGVGFTMALHETVDIARPMPPDSYPAVNAEHTSVSAIATGVGGAIGGAVLGAAYMASRKLDKPIDEDATAVAEKPAVGTKE